MQGFQVCTTLGSVYGAGERTQGLMHAREVFHPLSYAPVQPVALQVCTFPARVLTNLAKREETNVQSEQGYVTLEVWEMTAFESDSAD